MRGHPKDQISEYFFNGRRGVVPIDLYNMFLPYIVSVVYVQVLNLIK